MTEYLVTARLSKETSVQETAKVFDGLHALARRGLIRFGIEADPSRSHPRIVRLDARRSGEDRRIAIDLADQADQFSRDDLQAADIYFKRSLRQAPLAGLSGEFRAKVRPFGLNNPAIGLAAAGSMLKARRRTGRSWHELAEDARHLLALPDPRAFEASPAAPADALVLFQTRLWGSKDPAVLALNEERTKLIRALRKALGARFLGGLVPGEYALAHHPDLVTRLPYRMRAYPHLIKRALVAVSSAGLHDSVPFKVGEYLAAGRCIVAQAPTASLPAPLDEGRHYLAFETAEQCVAACDRLLSSPTLARRMRESNWRYYRRNSEPAAQMMSRLDDSYREAAGEPASGDRS